LAEREDRIDGLFCRKQLLWEESAMIENQSIIKRLGKVTEKELLFHIYCCSGKALTVSPNWSSCLLLISSTCTTVKEKSKNNEKWIENFFIKSAISFLLIMIRVISISEIIDNFRSLDTVNKKQCVIFSNNRVLKKIFFSHSPFRDVLILKHEFSFKTKI
jgi:multisubunit Na+/H+ antiporter MnhF subunit